MSCLLTMTLTKAGAARVIKRNRSKTRAERAVSKKLRAAKIESHQDQHFSLSVEILH